MGQLFDTIATALMICTFMCAAPLMLVAVVSGAI